MPAPFAFGPGDGITVGDDPSSASFSAATASTARTPSPVNSHGNRTRQRAGERGIVAHFPCAWQIGALSAGRAPTASRLRYSVRIGARHKTDTLVPRHAVLPTACRIDVEITWRRTIHGGAPDVRPADSVTFQNPRHLHRRSVTKTFRSIAHEIPRSTTNQTTSAPRAHRWTSQDERKPREKSIHPTKT